LIIANGMFRRGFLIVPDASLAKLLIPTTLNIAFCCPHQIFAITTPPLAAAGVDIGEVSPTASASLT